MREILFRGKRTGRDEWVTGDLSTYRDGSLAIRSWYCEVYDAYSVGPETVGQYTGLQDKNGAKIFEGDICSVSGELFKVEWVEDSAMFVLHDNVGRLSAEFGCFNAHDLEVIGNIHDMMEG